MYKNIKEALGQLMMIGVSGPTLTRGETRFIRDVQPSGVVYFRRNIKTPTQVAKMSERLWNLCSFAPPLIGIDQEGGRVERLSEPFTKFPGNHFLGRTVAEGHGVKWVRAQALAMATELKSIGVNYNFTPVADIDDDKDPQCPIIGNRSFGSNAEKTARLVGATVRAYREAGVVSCAKHFPGHGRAPSDSHLTLPVARIPKSQIYRRELLPFRRAIAARVPTIMTAHVIYPELDKKNPATLSPFILDRILRKRLGFKGVIVSDDLEMNAIAEHWSMGDAAVRAIASGTDLLLVCKSLDRAVSIYERLISAVERGELSHERVSESLRRVATLKRAYLKKKAYRKPNRNWRRGWPRHQRLSEKISLLGA